MEKLTTREIAVMQALCDGLRCKAIALQLGISPRTVEIHRGTAIRKLGAKTQTQAAVLFDREQAAHPASADVAELVEIIRGLSFAYKLVCDDLGKPYYDNPASWYSHARAALSKHSAA